MHTYLENDCWLSMLYSLSKCKFLLTKPWPTREHALPMMIELSPVVMFHIPCDNTDIWYRKEHHCSKNKNISRNWYITCTCAMTVNQCTAEDGKYNSCFSLWSTHIVLETVVEVNVLETHGNKMPGHKDAAVIGQFEQCVLWSWWKMKDGLVGTSADT